MRKPAAIFLLLLLLFNIVGYRAWFYYAEKKADIKMEASLDKNEYNENDLITLRIPLNMPYQLEKSRYERIDGEISLGGKIYKYVKRKISDGDLILACLPDIHKMILKKVKTEYGNYANDIGSSATNKESSHSNLPKNHSSNEYEAFLYSFTLSEILTVKAGIPDFSVSGLPDCLLAAPGKPPQLLS